MPGNNKNQSIRVHLKGDSDDFIGFATSEKDLENYRKKNSTLPLVEVADIHQVYVTHGHGAQGVFDEASDATLENNFGTTDRDEVLSRILRQGDALGLEHINKPLQRHG